MSQATAAANNIHTSQVGLALELCQNIHALLHLLRRRACLQVLFVAHFLGPWLHLHHTCTLHGECVGGFSFCVPYLGGLWGLGGAIFQEPSKLWPQELGSAGEGGVQRAQRLKNEDDIRDLEQACQPASMQLS